MARLSFVLLLALALLAACGGSAAPTAAPTVMPSPTPPNVSAFVSESFAVTVTGDVALEMPPGSVIYGYIAGMDVDPPVPEHHQLIFFGGDLNSSYQLTIEFDPDIQAGIHTFNGGLYGVNGGTVVANFSTYELRESQDENILLDFDQNVTGTLTITLTEDTISGSFEFTAEAVVAGAGSGPTRRKITAAGEFANVGLVAG